MFDIRRELGVKSVRQKVEKRILERIGHVFRMEDTRLTKAACLGWMEDLERHDKVPGKKRKTVLYWKKTLKEADIEWTQIGNLTQDRKVWKSMVRERTKFIDDWERKSGNMVPEERGSRNCTPSEEVDLTCEVCEKVCVSKAGLVIHKKRMHEISKEKVTFKCNDCDETFSQEANLKNHSKFCSKMIPSVPGKKKCSNCLGEYSKSYFPKHVKKCMNVETTQTQEAAPTVYRGETYRCTRCNQIRAKTNKSRHDKVCL